MYLKNLGQNLYYIRYKPASTFLNHWKPMSLLRLCCEVPQTGFLNPVWVPEASPSSRAPLLTPGPCVSSPGRACTAGQGATSSPSHAPGGRLNPSNTRASPSLRRASSRQTVKNLCSCCKQAFKKVQKMQEARNWYCVRPRGPQLSPAPWRTRAPRASRLPLEHPQPAPEFSRSKQSPDPTASPAAFPSP